MSKINLRFIFTLESRNHDRVFKYWDGPIPVAGTTVTLPLHSVNGRRLQIPERHNLFVNSVTWEIKLVESPSGYIMFEPTDVQAVNVDVFCTVL